MQRTIAFYPTIFVWLGVLFDMFDGYSIVYLPPPCKKKPLLIAICKKKKKKRTPYNRVHPLKTKSQNHEKSMVGCIFLLKYSLLDF